VLQQPSTQLPLRFTFVRMQPGKAPRWTKEDFHYEYLGTVNANKKTSSSFFPPLLSTVQVMILDFGITADPRVGLRILILWLFYFLFVVTLLV